MRTCSRNLRRRGSILVAALFLFIILLGLGLGIMTSQGARMRAALGQVQSAQAKELAWAGWEDVKVKLGKDLFFPNPVSGQDFFAYSEDLHDSNGDVIGTYTVVIDVRFEVYTPGPSATDEPEVDSPEGIYMITCVGKVGERAEEPIAERTLYFEVDMTTFDVIRMQDLGSL